MFYGIVSPLSTTGIDGKLPWILSAWTTCDLYSWLRSARASWWCSNFTTVSFGCMLDIFRLDVLQVDHFLLFLLPINYNVEIFILISLLLWAASFFRRLMVVVLVMGAFSVGSTWSWWCGVVVVGFPSGGSFVLILTFSLASLLKLLHLISINRLILTFRSNIWICTLLTPMVESICFLVFLIFETLLSFIIKICFLSILAHSRIIHLVFWRIHEVVL